MTDVCIICGKETRINQKHEWRKVTLKEKLQFWKKLNLGYCMKCWVLAMIQVHKLFSEEERLKVYLRMCDE